MTNIDQFESLFKAAAKTPFVLESVDLDAVLVVTDLEAEASARFLSDVQDFLSCLEREKPVQWHLTAGDQHRSVRDVLQQLERNGADLICTYRNLHAPATDYPYSLGVYLDVLSQATNVPVLVLPSPHRAGTAIPRDANVVMAIADHLTGDNHLVSYAARLTNRAGTLWLTHVEDEVVFERYMETISKIPQLDTETARREIMEQLLREPHDYIRTCAEGLREAGLPIHVRELVTMGQYLRDYQRLVVEQGVELLVINTKQNDQLAMHGVAYPLCVELRDTPILML